MRRMLRSRPSPSMAVAVTALVVAMGGTSYAVTSLPKNSVGSTQIRSKAVKNAELASNAVTSAKVRNGALRAVDFGSGQLPKGDKGETGAKGDAGAKGDPGAKGDTGTAGSALAFARVQTNGTLDPAQSKNVGVGNVIRVAVGRYCFTGLTPVPKNAVVTPQFFDRKAMAYVGAYGGCPAGTEVSVALENSAGAPADSPFMVAFN